MEFVSIDLRVLSPRANATIAIREPSLTIRGTAWALVRPDDPDGRPPPPPPERTSVSVVIFITDAGSVTRDNVLGDWEASFNITSGTKTIRVVTQWVEHFEEVQFPVHILLDQHPPELTIREPSQGEQRRGTGPTFSVRIAGKATDLAGVQAVQYRVGDNGPYQNVVKDSGDENTWNWHQDITELPLGSHTIQVRAFDKTGADLLSTDFRTITFVDSGAPEINITSPETNPQTITWSEGGVPVEIAGTASDPTTGVRSVEWRLDSGAWQSATNGSGTWANWRFTADIPAPGLLDIEVRATDGAGNTSTDAVQLDVAIPFELEDVFFASYLEDLVTFTRRRVHETGNAEPIPIDKPQLTATFHQPFDRLTHPSFRAVTGSPVAQVRIAVEVLRRFLNNNARFPHYCETAYSSLLINFGTSYTELRLARTADPETRKALANRLGITLEGLETLLLPPDQQTEATLQTVFGLRDTTQDPLTLAVDQAAILTMQLNKLRSSWLAQDQLYYDMNTDLPIPIIDPDIIEEVDVKSPVPGNLAFDLFNARRQWVAEQLAAIKQARESQNPLLAGFDHAVNVVLGTMDGASDGITHLLALEQRYTDGLDIESDLRAIPLEPAAFFVLMQLRKLSETGDLLESEWREFYDILVQVKKQREFKLWTETELQANLTLEPNFFSPRSTVPDLILWRSTWRGRRNWENKLDARIRQREILIQAHRAAIEATEAVALPLLRDALIATIDRQGYPAMDIADWLTQRLSISFKYSGEQKLSRLAQGVETLQDRTYALSVNKP